MSLMEQFSDPNTMHSLSFGDKMLASTITMLMGIGITFLVLCILWAFISIMGRVMKAASGNKTETAPAAAAAQAAPAAAPKAAPAAAPAAPKAAPAGGAGSIEVKAGAAGKVFKIEANVGQAVKKGDAVVIIEAMKMEIPVVAPEDGTVASIDVAVGDAIDSGAVLATLN